MQLMARKYNFTDRFNSPTLWSLIGANLMVAAMAMRFNWSLIELLWIYWVQSVIIGVINFSKLLSLSKYPPGDFIPNNVPARAFQKSKLAAASFFALHYGFFHAIYFVFLLAFSFAKNELHLGSGAISLTGILISSFIFLVNHFYSYIVNWPKEKLETDVGQQMFIPYLRIIPMHLTIIFGLLLATVTSLPFAPLLFFLSLKTISDVALHLYEHRNKTNPSR